MKSYSSEFLPKILFSLVVVISISSFAFVNSAVSAQEGKYGIYGIRHGGPGSGDPGCPSGYTIHGEVEDECIGKPIPYSGCFDPYTRYSTFGVSFCYASTKEFGGSCPAGSTLDDINKWCTYPSDKVFYKCPEGFTKTGSSCIGPRKF